MSEKPCGCPEHAELSPLALVLHEQSVGCGWRKVVERNRKHYESVFGLGQTNLGILQEVWDAGPFPHDGWLHEGDHEVVANAIRDAIGHPHLAEIFS
jgi:hypothetical protein